MLPKIICFGETLWDLLPSGKLPGGAPMNVAIHLKYNQYDPIMISRIGNDDLGKELRAYLEQKQLSTEYIQTDQIHQTGIVKVNVSNKHEVTYEIVAPVAWDFIEANGKVSELVKQSEVFIYGSLAARNEVSQTTLLHYLKVAKLKVFDVNFRSPHYYPEQVQELLHHADIVKMNHQELQEIAKWLGAAPDEQQNMQLVKQHFALQQVIVTRGEAGAAVLTEERYFEHAGFTVEVEDTIGSGDAFLATYLSYYLQQQTAQVSLERACMAGAYVASRPGATPTYQPADLDSLFPEV